MSALLVVILVTVGEANHPATLGAARAAREVIGADYEVEVREMDTVPNDERALRLGVSLHAAGIVELAWDPPAHRQARLRYHLDRRPGFTDRTIIFDEADDVAERGRTVGYAIASMMTVRPAEPVASPAAPPESSFPHGRPFVGAGTAARAAAHGAIDVVASGATGISGPAGGLGGSLSGRWYFAHPFALHTGVSVRAGQVAEVQSTSLYMHGAAGLAWVPFHAARNPPFEFGGRLVALLMREQLTHFSADDSEPVRATRWLPGAGAAIEASWLFSPNAGFLGSFGTEVAFGSTDVTLHLERVTTIPPVRLVLQAGVRATF